MVRPPLQVDGLQGRSYYKQRELIFRDNQQQKRGQSENSVAILLSGYSFVSLRHEKMASITDSIS